MDSVLNIYTYTRGSRPASHAFMLQNPESLESNKPKLRTNPRVSGLGGTQNNPASRPPPPALSIFDTAAAAKSFYNIERYCTRREKYSNVLQTHIVIVGQVRILVFLFRYSQTIRRRLGDAISKFGKKRYISHLSYNHYTCLENFTVFFCPCDKSQLTLIH